jgi:coenzyme F420-0:L-glutamate ligase/coenzyme F420-1:gamma-L-glutamate ligase
MTSQVSLAALQDIPEVGPGDDLAALIVESAGRSKIPLTDDTTLVIAQKIVSKSEGRFVRLSGVSPSARAGALAEVTRKDPRLVELILGESDAVLRAVPGVLIVRHRLGHVMANAGIDRSNVPGTDADETVLLLPLDPDRSARTLRDAIAARCGARPGVLISDSFGRPWRNGVVNVALGAAGVPSLVDRRGESDRMGRRLEVTQIAFADALCAAAALVMGEGAEGTPVVVIKGLAGRYPGAPQRNCSALIRPLEEDLFQ